VIDRLDRGSVRALDAALISVHSLVRGAVARLAEARAPDPSTRPAEAAFVRLEDLADASGLGVLYRPRIAELRLDAESLFAQGESRRLASTARYGTPDEPIGLDEGTTSLGGLAETLAVARGAIDDSPPVADPVGLLTTFASSLGLSIRVVVEPSLVADAASGERTLFLTDRPLGARAVARLAAHEIAGHLTASANARAQPLAIARVGTAGSWDDQEGVALALEQECGLLDAARMRRLGARAVAATVYVAGGDAADADARLRALDVDEGLRATAVKRAFRAGGSARDLAYLRGFTRVASALASGATDLDELRLGRVSIEALPALRVLRSAGFVVDPIHRPSFLYSLSATFSGTSFAMSPPRRAASFTRFEDT